MADHLTPTPDSWEIPSAAELNAAASVAEQTRGKQDGSYSWNENYRDSHEKREYRGEPSWYGDDWSRWHGWKQEDEAVDPLVNNDLGHHPMAVQMTRKNEKRERKEDELMTRTLSLECPGHDPVTRSVTGAGRRKILPHHLQALLAPVRQTAVKVIIPNEVVTAGRNDHLIARSPLTTARMSRSPCLTTRPNTIASFGGQLDATPSSWENMVLVRPFS